MKFRRGWLNELPLPRGERVGVRGFGRFRIKLRDPNPLILSFSPLGRRDAALRSRPDEATPMLHFFGRPLHMIWRSRVATRAGRNRTRSHRRRRAGRPRARRRSRLARHRLSADRAIGRLDLSAAHGPRRHPHHGILPALGARGAVETSPYPRDYAQDNIYLTSLTGYELGRERFPGIGQAPPPPESPQRRERCPQNMFDPILRAFAASQKSVMMRYRTRLVSFTQNTDAVTAEVENAETGAREQISARYIVGCDGARSLVRETLGIRMLGNPVLTYTTNVIFRCPHLLSLHDKGKAYRHILIGPEGTWSTIVAINGRDQWRFSIIGGSQQREYTTEEIKAAIRRAVGCDFEFEILSVLPWVRRELVAETYRQGRGFIAGDAAHAMSPTGGFGMNTGIGDAVDLSWKLAATLEGWGGDRPARFLHGERQPVGARNVTEASGNLRRMLSVGAPPDIADDTPQGAATRAKVGREFTEMMRREWFTLGIHLGYRYEGSPICWPDGSRPRPTRREPMCRWRGRATALRTPGSPTGARRSISSAAASRLSASARRRPTPRRFSMRHGNGACRSTSSPSPSRTLPRCTGANSCSCAPTAMSPGATTACRRSRCP